VIDAAFSQDVLDGAAESIVEVEKGRGVVLRATDHNCRQQKPLDACAGGGRCVEEAARRELAAAAARMRSSA